MKYRLYFTMICTLIVSNLLAQSYQRLLDSNKVWNVHNWFDNTGASLTTPFKFIVDTVINDYTYWRLYSSYDTNNNFLPTKLLLREDTIQQKVYSYSENDEDEQTLYDFSLELGDSIEITNNGCQKILVVIESDNITTYDGITRNRLKLSPQDEELYEYWIEGIGSSVGIIHVNLNFCFLSEGSALLCTYYNNTLIYSNPDWESCYISTVGIPSISDSKPEIYISPNPVTSESLFFYSLSPERNYTIEIWDIYGRKRYSSSQRVINTYLQISTNRFEPGIYIARIAEESINREIIKFVVE